MLLNSFEVRDNLIVSYLSAFNMQVESNEVFLAFGNNIVELSM